MRNRIASIVAVSVLLLSSGVAKVHGDLIYEFEVYSNFDSPGWTMFGGNIITDGTLGELGESNFVDWTIGFESNENAYTLTPANSYIFIPSQLSQGVFATSDQLFMQAHPSNDPLEQFSIYGPPGSAVQHGVAWRSSNQFNDGAVFLVDVQTNPQFVTELGPAGQDVLIGTAIVPEPASGFILIVATLAARSRRSRMTL